MMPYRVAIDLEGVESLRRLNRQEMERLLDQLGRLGHDPFRLGDYASQDSVGRPVQTIILGRSAITFWTDHAVREVRIVKIEPAD